MQSSILILAISVGVAHAIAIKSEGSRCGYEACPAGKPDFLNVHIVSHTHNDVGWLKTIDEYFYGDKDYIQVAGVQYILDSVIDELEKDPNRRFIYVETSFFWRWWNSRNESVHQRVQNLVQTGRLEFVSGGWCMNDEAGSYYVDIIDQMTLGFRFLNDTFGACGVPRVGWQIDPFGHSREQASLFAQMGFDGLFLGRLDYQDKYKRFLTKTTEFVWNASANLGVEGQLFTVVLPNNYSPPNGFCFDLLCTDEPIKDDPNLKGYNVDSRVAEFLDIVNRQASVYSSNNLIITMGNDFNYQNANSWFHNLDKLIKYVNQLQSNGSRINLFYSTPSCYLKALHNASLNWTVKTDDFLPYASDWHAYWTGYFTSRAAFKGYTKVTSNLLQIGKQLSVFSGVNNEKNLAILKRYQGDAQHHDAITGTAKQAVADDYSESLSIGQSAVEDAINDAFAVLLPENATIPPRQVFCHGLNVSYCNITENKHSFVVTVYNPLGHWYRSEIRFPVSGVSYRVTDPDNLPVTSELVAIPDQVMDCPEKGGDAQQDLVFQYLLKPCGFTSFFVQETKGFKIKKPKSKFVPKRLCKDKFISNQILKVDVNCSTNLLQSITNLVTNVTYNVQQNFYYYVGMNGNNSLPEFRASGAYIFRPNGSLPRPVTSVAKINYFKAEKQDAVVQEIHQTFNNYVSQVIRLYSNEPFVELEWMVGPIDVDDGYGKEIISKFKTDFETNALFYTDSNGREIQERRRDYRPTYHLNLTEKVASNYYPVNSRIFIQDATFKKDAQLTIITDRSQGGSSIQDGTVELMVHRRLLHDDAFGVGEPLNETGIDGEGLQVRGKHRLFVSSIADAAILHRRYAVKTHFPPLLSFAELSGTIDEWKKNFKTQGSFLRSILPDAVRLVTVEPWKNDTVLIRLENFLEIGEGDGDQPVILNLKDAFADFDVLDAIETSLGANIWVNDKRRRLDWKIEDNNLADEHYQYLFNATSEPLTSIKLYPMQIRTFICRIQRR